jgi:hypothetical protein
MHRYQAAASPGAAAFFVDRTEVKLINFRAMRAAASGRRYAQTIKRQDEIIRG